jgi:FdhD protein
MKSGEKVETLHQTEVPAPIVHFRRGASQRDTALRTLITERPLAIEVRGGNRYTLMRTPGHDRELAIGFLFTEGIIDGLDDILLLEDCPDNPDLLRVRLRNEKELPQRSLHLSSSCGLCGHQEIEALVAGLGEITSDATVPAALLHVLPATVLERQGLFRRTGGAHAAALFDREGHILALREDIGRHNALDKVLGKALIGNLPFEHRGIFLSGRASLEMIIKAARARAIVVASAKAPSALAVELSRRVGITLCGFVRGDEFAVFSHERRIRGGWETSAAAPVGETCSDGV